MLTAMVVADSALTSVDREIKKRFGNSSFLATQGIKYATAVGPRYDITLGLAKAQRLKRDPTVKIVKFIFENPEEGYLTALKNSALMTWRFQFPGSKEHQLEEAKIPALRRMGLEVALRSRFSSEPMAGIIQSRCRMRISGTSSMMSSIRGYSEEFTSVMIKTPASSKIRDVGRYNNQNRIRPVHDYD